MPCYDPRGNEPEIRYKTVYESGISPTELGVQMDKVGQEDIHVQPTPEDIVQATMKLSGILGITHPELEQVKEEESMWDRHKSAR